MLLICDNKEHDADLKVKAARSASQLKAVLSIMLFYALSACQQETAAPVEEPMIRGLKGYQVSQSANAEVRRYPSVVQPAQESKLSFQVGGKLNAIDLVVGQRVKRGEILASINPASLKLRVQQSTASLNEATAQLNNAKLDYDRKLTLLEKNYVTQSEIDNALSQVKSLTAQVDQAKRQVDLAKEDLSKAELLAPFDGVISSIDTQDFSQVNAGEIILGLYSEGSYEVSFSVPAIIINKLKVGDRAAVSFADVPEQNFVGHIKELGARAGQISAFPVVVALDKPPESLRAGMAAEVELSILIGSGDDGLLVPISSFYFGGAPRPETSRTQQSAIGTVFIYNTDTSTVSTRQVQIQGIRENMAMVYDGLKQGDIVAAAGVSYLHDGQQVKLLPLNN